MKEGNGPVTPGGPPVSEVKDTRVRDRIVLISLVVAAIGVAFLIHLTSQPSDATEPGEASALPTRGFGYEVPGATQPPELKATPAPGKPYEVPDEAELVPKERPEEQFKRDAEDAALAFLKIYLNANGADNEQPISYIDKLAPYATEELLKQYRAPYEGVTPEWNWLGVLMHEKGLNVSVEGFCTLGATQAPAVAFDENDGGNIPCFYRQVVRDGQGNEYSDDDLGIESNILDDQRLKMVKDGGQWKVAKTGAYGS